MLRLIECGPGKKCGLEFVLKEPLGASVSVKVFGIIVEVPESTGADMVRRLKMFFGDDFKFETEGGDAC